MKIRRGYLAKRGAVVVDEATGQVNLLNQFKLVKSRYLKEYKEGRNQLRDPIELFPMEDQLCRHLDVDGHETKTY